jgi:hypothetical protein
MRPVTAVQRRDGARHRPHEERRRRALLHRRVDHHVDDERDEGEQGGQPVRRERQDRQGERGHRQAEGEGRERLDAAGGQRPVARPAHAGVDVALDEAVERVRGTDHRGGAEDRDEGAGEGDVTRREREAPGARDHHEAGEAGLGERDEVPRDRER